MVSIFQIGISRNTKCENLVSFPKSGHIYLCLKLLLFVYHIISYVRGCVHVHKSSKAVKKYFILMYVTICMHVLPYFNNNLLYRFMMGLYQVTLELRQLKPFL